jgi:hypothetical protein
MARQLENRPSITAALEVEARRYPGGWVYQIDGGFARDDAVPPSAIIGAWKVGEDGRVTGEFLPNPNYRSGSVSHG